MKYFMSDIVEFARSIGAKDKKKRKIPSISSHALTGAMYGVGLTGLYAGAQLATPGGRNAIRNRLKSSGLKPSIRNNLGKVANNYGLDIGKNALLGAGVGASQGALYKLPYTTSGNDK